MAGIVSILILLIALMAFVLGQNKAAAIGAQAGVVLHSRPSYHGSYSLLWVLVAGWGVLILLEILGNGWLNSSLMGMIAEALPDAPFIEHQLVLNDAIALSAGQVASKTGDLRLTIAAEYASRNNLRIWVTVLVSLGAALAAFWATNRLVRAEFRARNRTERIIQRVLMAMAAVAVLTTIGIVFSLIFETVTFFDKIGWRFDKYLFGTTWSPLSGVQSGVMDADKVGAVPLFAGTLLITLIAMVVATPIGLFAAIYLSDFASARVRTVAKPMLEVLAGIPTVVYGFFAAITVAPFLRETGETIGIPIASESALVAGIVMGIMIIPFISSLSDDVINAVPQALRDGSYGLGATKAETIRQVILPAALPGIVSAVLLGVSRAIGETMIVVMAAGQGANLTANPFEAVTTVTVQIVMLITGDTEADTAAGPAFTLGFTLFVLTLLMNIVAQRMVRRYREMYD